MHFSIISYKLQYIRFEQNTGTHGTDSPFTVDVQYNAISMGTFFLLKSWPFLRHFFSELNSVNYHLEYIKGISFIIICLKSSTKVNK